MWDGNGGQLRDINRKDDEDKSEAGFRVSSRCGYLVIVVDTSSI